MEATAQKGIWREDLSDEVSINFDTTRTPERATIQKRGSAPIHLDYEDGIGEKEILRAKLLARQSFGIK